MPDRPAAAHRRSCHWAHIAGPLGGRRAGMSKVWICEYPYPTMREDGPNEECEGCPTWEERQRDSQEAEPAADAVRPRVPHFAR